jgi:hypothetical protein
LGLALFNTDPAESCLLGILQAVAPLLDMLLFHVGSTGLAEIFCMASVAGLEQLHIAAQPAQQVSIAL